MNIGLFGGTFDPPHIGHLKVAHFLCQSHLVDQVWFVPVYRHPWAKTLQKTDLTSYQHRLNMITLLKSDNILVKEYQDISFVYPTIQYFQKKYPQHHFSWVMGSEYLPKFNLFLKDHPQLSSVPFFIYPRKDHPFTPSYSNMTMLKDAPLVTISSTDIRKKIKNVQPISDLVPDSVNQYIHKNKLYN